MCKNALFHWESLFVVSTSDAQNIAFPLITEQIGWDFGAHTLFVENTQLVLIVDFEELLSSSSWIRNVQLKSRGKESKINLISFICFYSNLHKCILCLWHDCHSLLRIAHTWYHWEQAVSCHRTPQSKPIHPNEITKYFDHPQNYPRFHNKNFLFGASAMSFNQNFFTFTCNSKGFFEKLAITFIVDVYIGPP